MLKQAGHCLLYLHCCREGETTHTGGAGAALPGLEFCIQVFRQADLSTGWWVFVVKSEFDF